MTTRYTVHLRRYDAAPYEGHDAETRADSPAEAICNVARRFVGHGRIGTLEHFRGGDTYHVQFAIGRRVAGRATNLSIKYVAQVSPA